MLAVVHLHEVCTLVIVDGQVRELPSRASRGITLVPRRTVGGLKNAPKLLVYMQQFTRRLLLIANDWLNEIEHLQAGQPQSCDQATAGHVGARRSWRRV